MNAKHTPGPWKVAMAISSESQPWVYAREGHGSVCVLGTATERRFNDPLNSRRRSEGEANALLIASAPDLLDALYSILNMETSAANGEHLCPTGIDLKWHFNKVRAAIRKATGAGGVK